MRWRKLGRIFAPDGGTEWMASHATTPTPEHLADDRYRIHFAARDPRNRSSSAYVEIDLSNPQDIIRVSKAPLLSPGELGAFDDSGVLPSSMVSDGARRHLYYTGYHLGVTVPFRNAVGLACESAPDQGFERFAKGPILPLDRIDPFLTITPFVLKEKDRWRMWYSSGSRWEPGASRPKHYYHIRYAESEDGIAWQRDGTICIDYQSTSEHAITRPCVVKDPDCYRMWYCSRGEAYRIGYAESANGINWQRRDDHVGINPSAAGWDAEMLAYPYVFDHGDARYMLYNGNDYGRTGFGLAVLDS